MIDDIMLHFGGRGFAYPIVFTGFVKSQANPNNKNFRIGVKHLPKGKLADKQDLGFRNHFKPKRMSFEDDVVVGNT